jgi:hypothetical protein
MSSRKQATSKPYWKRYTGQIPGFTLGYSYDQDGNLEYHPDTPADENGAPIDDDRYRLVKQYPNRAARRRAHAELRRTK